MRRRSNGLLVALTFVLLTASGCGHHAMGVVPVQVDNHPARPMPAAFKTRADVLYRMRTDCYFCPPNARVLGWCALIKRSDHAQAKLMEVRDFERAGVAISDPNWRLRPQTRVWIALVHGDIEYPNGPDARKLSWIVFGLPSVPGLHPVIIQEGFAEGPQPTYFDSLPDLSPA